MPRNRTMTYCFDDLPMIIDKGIPAGFVSGSAKIIYTDDVTDFSVEDVFLDGYVPVTYTDLQRLHADRFGLALAKTKLVSIEVDGALESIIRQRLEGELSGKVEDAIREEIEAERQYRRDEAADRRRDAMREAV